MGNSDHPPFFEDDEGTAQIHISQLPVPRASAKEHPYLVVYGGEGAGRMIPVDEELTIGRSRHATLTLSGEGVSRLHARLYRDGERTMLEDLGSTNGTRVNGALLEAPAPLSDGDQIQIGVNRILKFSLQDEAQARFQQELFEQALRDPLTKISNRRALLERLESDLSHAQRHGAPLSLLMFDLDRFKQVNDTFGHLAGDHVLRELARLIGETVRREDLFARYGGEEFAMCCRSTDLRHAAELGERIRARVDAHPFVYSGRPVPVTISVGVAQASAEDSVEALIERADRMLYRAKREGRNRVVSAPA